MIEQWIKQVKYHYQMDSSWGRQALSNKIFNRSHGDKFLEK